ncbi:FMN-binding negative transcriptional regulator [Burkholderia sp. S171]|uniref:FMN-binding negative transcriptional regulator n=1 Tax=Burkholderia sp. S171 TaxID=1641860 RepID=UPI00131EA602|nr:FMN-binding negative transcriptional regulator [Burkholderia sp. S171]
MYLPPYFEEKRPEVLHRLMADNPLAALVTHGANGLDANHVPFEFDADQGEHGILRAHVARANSICQEIESDSDALVIFQAASGYISPTFYPSKQETHRQVPTYNYLVVHAHGRITIRDDETFVRGVVARLARKMEAGEAAPWKMGDAPPDFIQTMLQAIVGIEIEVTRLVGKAKLSQNKVPADRIGAINGVRQRETDAATALADAMFNAPPPIENTP